MLTIDRIAAKVIATEYERRPPSVRRWWQFAERIEGIRANEHIIKAAEARLNCSLPEPYRTWLQRVGYGIGPFGGLMPTNEPRTRPIRQSATAWGTYVVQPIFDLGLNDEPDGLGEFAEISSVHPEFIDGLKDAGRCHFSLKSARGIMAINEGDNGSYHGLVVGGPLRGKIVQWLCDHCVSEPPPDGRQFGALLWVPGGVQEFLPWLDGFVDEDTAWRRRAK